MQVAGALRDPVQFFAARWVRPFAAFRDGLTDVRRYFDMLGKCSIANVTNQSFLFGVSKSGQVDQRQWIGRGNHPHTF